ncbi:MAG: hypothetical protein HY707_02775 [Ignavibacteriae bacterium]|nr:hypothetical protein [Ignavibacteriota bacterium]
MKSVSSIVFFLVSVLFVGCEDRIIQPDIIPPSAPRGLYTATGDNLVEIFWLDNPEPDVEGYHVYVSSSYDGEYGLIGTTQQLHFVDRGARNGTTYYYAVSAYDVSGNESRLSKDVVYDTPRPEGYDVAIRNYRTDPNLSGYDFSTYSVGPYDDQYTDVFFEYYNGLYYMNVWDDTEIQDVGYTESLYDIGEVPTRGWSPTKDVQLIIGHTYVVLTWDSHYAKMRVISLTPGGVMFDWAYQLQQDNPRLKISIPLNRGSLELGTGAKSRK